MDVVLQFEKPTSSHCDVRVFVNGASSGVLTLRQEELAIFQMIIADGCLAKHDTFLSRGNPDPP